jgi:ribosome biogenesis protein Tsr3
MVSSYGNSVVDRSWPRMDGMVAKAKKEEGRNIEGY